MTRMTKIIVSALVALAITCAAGILFWRGRPLAFEEVLPEAALVYVKFSNVREKWRTIRASDFWQNLQKIDFTYFWEKSSLTAAQKELLQSLTDKLSDPILATVFDEFFSREFAVAVYPPQVPVGATEQELNALTAQMPSYIFIVTRPSANAEFMEFLSRWWGESSQDFTIERIPLGEYILNRVTLPKNGVQIGFVHIRDVLIIGLGDNAARWGVAVYSAQKPSLAADKNYRRSQARAMKSPDLAAEVNLGKLISLAKDFSNATVQRSPAQPFGAALAQSSSLKSVAGLETLGISGKWEDTLRLKFDLYTNASALDPTRAADMRCPAVKNETLSFIPSDAIGYQWSNCFDLPASWAQLKEEVVRSQQRPGGGRATSNIDELEKALGASIENDVLPAFGDEIGGYLQDIRAATSSSFPVPKFVFFVKIKDQAKAGQLTAKLDERFAANLKKEDYHGFSIAYFVPVPGIEVEPAYGILGDYFLAAFDRTSIKDAIDTMQERSPALAGSDVFQKVVGPIAEKSRFVQIFRLDQCARKLEDLLEWSDARQSASDTQKEAFQAGSAKRLAEVTQGIQTKKGESEEIKKEITALEATIPDLESRQQDAASQHTQLEQLKGQVTALTDEIAAAEGKRKEIEGTSHGYEQYRQDRQKREEIKNNVVKPLLKALGFIKALGSRGVWGKDVLESTLVVDVH